MIRLKSSLPTSFLSFTRLQPIICSELVSSCNTRTSTYFQSSLNSTSPEVHTCFSRHSISASMIEAVEIIIVFRKLLMRGVLLLYSLEIDKDTSSRMSSNAWSRLVLNASSDTNGKSLTYLSAFLTKKDNPYPQENFQASYRNARRDQCCISFLWCLFLYHDEFGERNLN